MEHSPLPLAPTIRYPSVRRLTKNDAGPESTRRHRHDVGAPRRTAPVSDGVRTFRETRRAPAPNFGLAKLRGRGVLTGVRSYISEPDRGRRNWTKHPAARAAVYRNRRRIRGARGQRLLRQRGERLERPNAHLYETGGMRRTHLRGHENILKRLVVHCGAFNLAY